jgi:hypothetical protein
MNVIEVTQDGHESDFTAGIEEWARINACPYVRIKKWQMPISLNYEDGLIFVGAAESAIWAAHLASRFESAGAVIDPVDSEGDDLLQLQFAHAVIFKSLDIECKWAANFNRSVREYVSIDDVLADMVVALNYAAIICFGDGE